MWNLGFPEPEFFPQVPASWVSSDKGSISFTGTRDTWRPFGMRRGTKTVSIYVSVGNWIE